MAALLSAVTNDCASATVHRACSTKPAVPKAVAAELQMIHRTVTATVLAGEKSNADERETVFPAAITTFSTPSEIAVLSAAVPLALAIGRIARSYTSADFSVTLAGRSSAKEAQIKVRRAATKFLRIFIDGVIGAIFPGSISYAIPEIKKIIHLEKSGGL